jgi:hypothetical protein
MVDTFSFKRLISRAPLGQVSPEVIRLVLVSDRMELLDLWSGRFVVGEICGQGDLWSNRRDWNFVFPTLTCSGRFVRQTR